LDIILEFGLIVTQFYELDLYDKRKEESMILLNYFWHIVSNVRLLTLKNEHLGVWIGWFNSRWLNIFRIFSDIIIKIGLSLTQSSKTSLQVEGHSKNVKFVKAWSL